MSFAFSRARLGSQLIWTVVFSITDPSGKHQQKSDKTMPNASLTVTFFGWMHLSPGQKYRQTLVLNQWFSFKNLGSYQINVQLKEPLTIGKQVLSINVPALSLNVMPFDRQKLASRCSELASRIKKRNTGDESEAARAAEKALSYVVDPVVVPNWNEVLEYVDGDAISSLYEIGNIEAVRVLTRAMGLDKELKSQARSALEALAQRSPDPAVRAQAQLALRHNK